MKTTMNSKKIDSSSTNLNDSRVVLNVGGVRFETQRATLKKLPATRLSKLTPQMSFYDPVLKEYFFDRHPGVFSQILNYYRTGQLHYPTNVCGPLFEDELSYWGIQREDVEPCCWMTYTKHRSTQETLQTLDSLGLDTVRSTRDDLMKKFSWRNESELTERQKIFMIVWQLFEEPRSSFMSKIIASVSILFILVSILVFMLQTSTGFQTIQIDFVNVYVDSNKTAQTPVQDQSLREPIAAFDVIEWICNSWFIFEIVVRFIVAPSKRSFCTSILNWIDFLGIFYFCFTYTFYHSFQYSGHYSAVDLLSTIRVARMFKLCNLHPRLKVIVTTVAYSSSLLSLLIYFILTAILISGASFYYVERLTNPSDSQLVSIIDGMWLALGTLATIGYGDTVPKSIPGMILGALTTIVGVLIIDLPMPIIVEIFTNFYTHLQARQQLPKQRRRITPATIPRKVQPLVQAKSAEPN